MAQARGVLEGQPRSRTAVTGRSQAARPRLDSLPPELLRRLYDDPRQMLVNRHLAKVLHDPAVARGFADLPPPVQSLADVERAIDRLESSLAGSAQLRDAPLAALAGRLHRVPIPERAAAHARIVRAASACPRPLQALVELQRQVEGLPEADRQAAKGLIAAHPAGRLAQAQMLAEDMLDPSTEMPALLEALDPLQADDRSGVLGTVAQTLFGLHHVQVHCYASLAMNHHDLPWPPEAAAGLLRRISWIPDDVRQALEKRAVGV